MAQKINHEDLKTRRAIRSDLPRLLELLADDILGKSRDAGSSDDACYVQAFEAIAADTNQYLLLGELDGRVIAMLQLTFIPGLSRRGALRANIEAVRVDSSLRGQGIGNWIIAQALLIAQERGCDLAQLTSDKSRTEAHRFYARLGFTATHEGFKLKLKTCA
ncbi:GNAT family N-acetyltransferase [Glaciimonas soli]|uniref:GNAT family N-acetyltransferase n=1 Tax=Glaciimonas soli TaxID=2590999 RepID=A0A843YPK4_9BURK|nr:GNAT family N-acetyltransferase [Glaciimonas soli]MQR01425.1 GNAT family N-acetyltransferase [Glaciimonas soli]